MKRVTVHFRACIIIGVLALAVVSAPAQDGPGENDSSHLFLQANQAYKDGEYAAAAALYERIIDSGVGNGHLFYNLGNAYVKTGDIGLAVLNYRRAELFMPRDEDLRANIAYVHDLKRDSIACSEPFIEKFCFWYSKLSCTELVTVFLILNAFLWGVLSLKLFFKKETLTMLVSVGVFLVVVSGASAGVKLYNLKVHHTGVVLAGEIMVRSGNSVNDTVLFKLHEGAEFNWLQEEDGWVKIRLCDAKKGWVRRDTVEEVEKKVL